MSRRLEFVITPDEANVRLDKLVAARVPELGRKRTADLFRAGAVHVAGRTARKGELARTGQHVEVELGEPDRAQPEPNSVLDIRYETAHVVIVSKPAGQPSAALPGSAQNTLAGALLGRYPELASIGYSPREPGLLHRLDTGTSGLVVAARTEHAFETLKTALKAGQLHKRYLAVVDSAGLPGFGVIDGAIAPDVRDKRRVRVVRDLEVRGARSALTNWRVVERGSRFALLELEVNRAQRHQIRVHLASIGHPIVGDARYGGTLEPRLGERHALHASYVAWGGDEVVPGFNVEDPLPAEMGILMAG